MAEKKPNPLVARFTAIIAWVTGIVEWAMALKPVRVFTYFGQRRGPLLANGLSYQSIFALFAALWVGFSIAALVIKGNPDLLSSILETIGASVPGLIDTGDGSGAIDPSVLLSASILGWTGAIALISLLFTAIGWFASARDAVRDMFGLPGPMTNFLLLKLKDLGLAIAFGIAVVVSAALSLFSTQALGLALDGLGIGDDADVATALVRITGLALTFALDAAVLAVLYRVLAGAHIPYRRLIAGSIIGAVALGGLKVLGTALLGGASSNPLLASFAVIIGLLIWFNLVCQVILLGAAWIAVSMADRGVPLVDPRIEAARVKREAEEKAAAEAAARAAADEARAARGNRFTRLFRRRR